MKKAAFLSMDSLKDFECYDHLAVKPLNQLGWDVEEVSWRNKNVIWSDYDAVVVRSTWDYQTDHKKFLNVLVEINDSSAHLENDLSILKWNMNKKYLADLEEKGITIVESIWEKNYQPGNLAEYFDKLNCEEIIIKPNVSGNADNTFRLSKNILSSDRLHNCEDELLKIFNEREFMVQPFIKHCN